MQFPAFLELMVFGLVMMLKIYICYNLYICSTCIYIYLLHIHIFIPETELFNTFLAFFESSSTPTAGEDFPGRSFVDSETMQNSLDSYGHLFLESPSATY